MAAAGLVAAEQLDAAVGVINRVIEDQEYALGIAQQGGNSGACACVSLTACSWCIPAEPAFALESLQVGSKEQHSPDRCVQMRSVTNLLVHKPLSCSCCELPSTPNTSGTVLHTL